MSVASIRIATARSNAPPADQDQWGARKGARVGIARRAFSSSRFSSDVVGQRGREPVGHGHRSRSASCCGHQKDCAG